MEHDAGCGEFCERSHSLVLIPPSLHARWHWNVIPRWRNFFEKVGATSAAMDGGGKITLPWTNPQSEIELLRRSRACTRLWGRTRPDGMADVHLQLLGLVRVS